MNPIVRSLDNDHLSMIPDCCSFFFILWTEWLSTYRAPSQFYMFDGLWSCGNIAKHPRSDGYIVSRSWCKTTSVSCRGWNLYHLDFSSYFYLIKLQRLELISYRLSSYFYLIMLSCGCFMLPEIWRWVLSLIIVHLIRDWHMPREVGTMQSLRPWRKYLSILICSNFQKISQSYMSETIDTFFFPSFQELFFVNSNKATEEAWCFWLWGT